MALTKATSLADFGSDINPDGSLGIVTATSATFTGTDAVGLTTGTTAQRPASPDAGMIRYNNETEQFEGYSTAWGGWWHILYFVFATLVIYLAYYSLLHLSELKKGVMTFITRPGIKNTLFLLLCFMLSSMLFTSIFTGFSNFTNFLVGAPLRFVKMKEVGISTVWPNVFTTVAEQNTASLSGVISQIGFGNWFLFLVGISGLIAAIGAFLLLFANGMPLVIMSGCIIGLGSGIFMATNWALGTDLAPKTQAGKFLGISNMAGAGAGIIGAGIGGPMADFFNALQTGLGYLVIVALYGMLFLFSTLVLTQVREAN